MVGEVSGAALDRDLLELEVPCSLLSTDAAGIHDDVV
jgi:hypothetical protein